MAQLAEQSLPTPEVCGLNPVIGKILCIDHVFTVNIWKDENKEKEAENGLCKKYLSEQNGVSEQSELTPFWER